MPRLALPVRLVLQVAIVGGLAVVLAGCGLGETAAGDVPPGSADPGATAIVMRDNSFEPASVTVPNGSAVQFEISNQGAVNHNFTSEALNVSSGPVKPGETVTVTVAVPAGATQFLCTWHPGMVIQVTGS